MRGARASRQSNRAPPGEPGHGEAARAGEERADGGEAFGGEPERPRRGLRRRRAAVADQRGVPGREPLETIEPAAPGRAAKGRA